MIANIAVYERLEARRFLFEMPQDERELRIQIAREVWAQCVESGHAKRSRVRRIPCTAHEDACRTILGLLPLSSLESRTLWRHAKAGHPEPFPTPPEPSQSFEEFVHGHMAYEERLKELL